MSDKNTRSDMGMFVHVDCMKQLIQGVNNALGAKVAQLNLSSAGRERGIGLYETEKFPWDGQDYAALTAILDNAFGKNGTHLCGIAKVENEEGKIRVSCYDTVESYGQSNDLGYTLGAIQGVLESMLGKTLRGYQTQSIASGADYDVIEYLIM